MMPSSAALRRFVPGGAKFTLPTAHEQVAASSLQSAMFAGGKAHFMMSLAIADLGAWRSHTDSPRLAETFSVGAPQAPTMQPSGAPVAYLLAPGSPLWHIIQA